MENQLIQDAMREGNWARALSIAKRFRFKGPERKLITGAHDAAANPEFYRSLGRDPDQMIAEGIEALKKLFGTL